MFINLNEQELDKYIYRIISIRRLVELFETKQNVLVKPRLWEDPFENFVLRSKVRLLSGKIVEYNFHDRMYGQCWSLHKASDAMWRIYSPEGVGIRIRTTIRSLLTSLYSTINNAPEAACCLGKVLYLNKKELKESANNTFDDDGISVENLFKSLLIKRNAFKHENEIRLLYEEIDDNNYRHDSFRYEANPHSLISQLMIDPRLSKKEARKLKEEIRENIGYEGEVKRSLLYALPDDMVVDAKAKPGIVRDVGK